MIAEKIDFLQNKLIALLSSTPSDTRPLWGKMSLQQMIEHQADVFRIASGRSQQQTIVTPPEHLPKMREFLLSDKPFRKNTVNPLLPQDPAPVKLASIEEALKELQAEIDHFFSVFKANKDLTTHNPFFGNLNFEMNVHFLYKHALHHLKQFGIQHSSNPSSS